MRFIFLQKLNNSISPELQISNIMLIIIQWSKCQFAISLGIVGVQ